MRPPLVLITVASMAFGQVPYERILHAEKEPQNWLTYSGNYAGQRYSGLAQISTSNVSALQPVWTYQVDDLNKIETSPLAIDGIIYVTEPPSNVTALDAKTGRPIWKYRRKIPTGARNCCGQVNRGAAILGDSLYIGTIDAHLVCLDARSGVVRWDVPIADYKLGYAITAAPLAINGKVIVGVSGGEFGIRGFLDAIDAATGVRVWRFWTIPTIGEPGHESWSGNSWKTGSAATWVTGTFDPGLNLLYWTTGNPGPDWNGDTRRGDNLYSDTVLALNPDTGTLKWYFQFTPHDVQDLDSNQVPVLIDGVFEGRPRKLVVVANRNAFFYVLDRESGQFLLGKPYARQTWAEGLTETGRPMRAPNSTPTTAGTELYPDVNGATNWFSPSYDPKNDQFYVAVREGAAIYYSAAAAYKPGVSFVAGGWKTSPEAPDYGCIRAFRPETAEMKWEFKLHSKPWAGVLSTAGGLVFGGSDEGNFFALDSKTGAPLWNYQTGGKIFANPISFQFDGKQYVLIAAGHSIFAFSLRE